MYITVMGSAVVGVSTTLGSGTSWKENKMEQARESGMSGPLMMIDTIQDRVVMLCSSMLFFCIR